MTRKLNVDLDELAVALSNASYEMRYYLDLETGEVVLIPGEFSRELEYAYEEIYDEEGNRIITLEEYLEEECAYEWQREVILLADQVEQMYGSRYISIEEDDPHTDYRDMERFIRTVEDDEVRNRLWRAIQGRGAFRYFKDVLYDYPEVRQAWFAFKDARQEQRMVRWLEEQGIEVVQEEEDE